jgi:hypothetical protein
VTEKLKVYEVAILTLTDADRELVDWAFDDLQRRGIDVYLMLGRKGAELRKPRDDHEDEVLH